MKVHIGVVSEEGHRRVLDRNKETKREETLSMVKNTKNSNNRQIPTILSNIIFTELANKGVGFPIKRQIIFYY